MRGAGTAGGTPLMLECVPNVSEGRDAGVVRRLAGAARAAGARVVDVHSDVDHHRSVFTFLGEAAVVERAALALARQAVELIDLRRHAGVHPRVGALDVMPFVPLRGCTMGEAVAAARRVGRALAAATSVPVFFYGAAATRPGRELPALRRGGLEDLSRRMREPGWQPDAGPPHPHPAAGVALVGARGPLIAFNALLDSADLAAARAIARALRESSGGLPAVRALAVPLASRRRVQVTMNLLDYRRTPVATVVERLLEEARRYSVGVSEFELVGCAPADALALPPGASIARLKPSQILDAALFG